MAVDGDSVGVIQQNITLSPKPLREAIDRLDQLYQTPNPFRMVISYREKPVRKQKGTWETDFQVSLKFVTREVSR